MSIKHKVLNAVSAHPKLAAFGIALALTMAVGTAMGMFDNQHVAFASTSANKPDGI